jgi:hypothetical protein
LIILKGQYWTSSQFRGFFFCEVEIETSDYSGTLGKFDKTVNTLEEANNFLEGIKVSIK